METYITSKNQRDISSVCDIFFDKIFILSLILSPETITPGLDLSTDARGTEYFNSVPVGTEFQKVLSILNFEGLINPLVFITFTPSSLMMNRVWNPRVVARSTHSGPNYNVSLVLRTPDHF